MRKVRKDLGKGFNDFDCNPIGKARIIADAMTEIRTDKQKYLVKYVKY